jgi:hypothetical protein
MHYACLDPRMRQIVPTELTQIQVGNFLLVCLEVVNDTAGMIKFGAYDKAGLAIVPTQEIGAGAVMTYLADWGAPVAGGMFWIASAPGLVGWYKMKNCPDS